MARSSHRIVADDGAAITVRDAIALDEVVSARDILPAAPVALVVRDLP